MPAFNSFHESDAPAAAYVLPDCSKGERGGANPLERYSWQDLRDEIYGGR